MNLGDFSMDTITLPGSLESKLDAANAAGFSQITLWAKDLAGHPDGYEAALNEVRLSGLRVNGIQVMRDYEGLSGPLHRYKVETVKTMLKLCEAVGAERLLICSSTSAHASGDVDHIAADLRKVAMLATPLGIRVGYEALSWGRHVSDFELSWEIVQRADRANLGVCIDAFHVLANCGLNGTNFDALATIPGERIAFVQLSDFLWKAVRTPEERIETARHLRVFPGEGVHSAELSRMIRMIDRSGYRGDWSFEVFNDDYLQMPVDIVAQRARDAAMWVAAQSERRSLPRTLVRGSH
ncbi:MAG TPA: sugar phosphate isomerase/epimerase [Casimicrobium huifangae]|uniref:sugar phosphate isomerase/epimerase family protein n=1 Tax=Casimicrobium huifangae TaxID=2591109 RepID=UPI0012EBCDBB|nr:sugar phosphate isomerase/epimerase [Casimicrobium huifangae]HOB03108.1 sugar phosphate isomerase/epimerase [Casimicrobium huifangae]HQA34162.1 sugar phosphate isomerase/epimerase [Casimicrobium huifangae]HQD65904.1 sugar phosphate isomerase/epimerase [Casimicrobium huifangae]